MSDNLSVLVLTTSFPVDSSIAVGVHVIEKCRHLVKNGLHLQVIVPHHPGLKTNEIIDGIQVKRFRYFFPLKWQRVAYGAGIPTNLMNSRLAVIQLPFFLASFFIAAIKNIKTYDILHCHWSIAGLVGVMVGKLYKKKVVLMVHGAEVFVLGKNPVLKFVLKHADCLISNSTFTRDKTQEVYPAKHSVVISPGVDTNRFYHQSKISNLRYYLNIAADEIFVFTLGKFIPRKGFEYLIKAFHIIVNQKEIKNIKLRIGGRGPLKPEYERLINQYLLNDFIGFLEYIRDEDIASYFSDADMFVLPSIIDDRGDTEGLGVVLLEANACRTPVIGSKVGGIPDIIKNGVNGFLVEQKKPDDLAEKIIRLAGDRKLREQMGENGRKVVNENFNWDRIAKRIIEIYGSKLN